MYTLERTSDLNGRVIKLKHPSQLAPVVSGVRKDTTRYAYDGQTGRLQRVTDPLGNAYQYADNLRDELESLALPRSYAESYAYDLDGNLNTHGVTSAGSQIRQTALRYDGRGRNVKLSNPYGAADTMSLQLSGLGYVVSSDLRSYGKNAFGDNVRFHAKERFTLDPLGDLTYAVSDDTSRIVGNSIDSHHYRDRTMVYDSVTGRLAVAWNAAQSDTTKYDAAGNIVFQTQSSAATTAGLDDRASYYAADATDTRAFAAPQTQVQGPFKTVFEEYRYDALGRRVLVRARRWCKDTESKPCRLSFVRRTVWDGDQELWEIQMPESSTYRENDTAQVPDITPSGSGNYTVIPATFSGRVGYTYGLRLDQPLSITRIGYADKDPGTAFRPVAPFTIVPLWDFNGQAIVGTYGNGELRKCTTYQSVNRCIYATWPATWYVYYRNTLQRSSWHGTLLEDKKDAAGNLYRRNRYYDPSTGRFTQEDPIGLAGGLNLYGFAGGDPVNFSDPFGLAGCASPSRSSWVGVRSERGRQHCSRPEWSVQARWWRSTTRSRGRSAANSVRRMRNCACGAQKQTPCWRAASTVAGWVNER